MVLLLAVLAALVAIHLISYSTLTAPFPTPSCYRSSLQATLRWACLYNLRSNRRSRARHRDGSRGRTSRGTTRLTLVVEL
jgi:hypothetical protein